MSLLSRNLYNLTLQVLARESVVSGKARRKPGKEEVGVENTDVPYKGGIF